MARLVRDTSKKAYRSLTDLSRRRQEVLTAIFIHKTIPNFDIAKYLRLPINQVTGRTRELFQDGLVREEFKDYHPVTGRLVIFWGLTKKGEELLKNSLPLDKYKAL